VDYFGETAYLAQTGQLYLETAAMALGKVYCFGPTFRAEKSKTRRHLTEFWMIEPEVAFYELPDLERLAEDFITHLVQAVLAANRDRPRPAGPRPGAAGEDRNALPAHHLQRGGRDAARPGAARKVAGCAWRRPARHAALKADLDRNRRGTGAAAEGLEARKSSSRSSATRTSRPTSWNWN
jgi:hypothetical protein